MKKIAVLGSTGSIGVQTLDVLKAKGELFDVFSLVAFSDIKKVLEQQREFSAPYVGVINLHEQTEGVHTGENCLLEAVEGADTVVVATRGIVALPAVLKALKEGKTVALANKETLVCGGKLVNEYAKKYGGKLVTVDSEHSAVMQCLNGENKKNVSKIILTASGGAFRNFSYEQLKNVTAADALKHPTWRMGQKITIDCATMMNKGLEIIEACRLFDVSEDKVEVVVHPQSIVHSMVEFADGSVKAQLASPDMKLPIQYALTYPERFGCDVKPLDLFSLPLEFFVPDENKFKCMSLCREAIKKDGLYPTALNAANDVCVENFVNGKIGFFDIADTIERVLNEFVPQYDKVDVKSIFDTDRQVKIITQNIIDGVL